MTWRPKVWDERREQELAQRVAWHREMTEQSRAKAARRRPLTVGERQRRSVAARNVEITLPQLSFLERPE
jgi:hypothetical protein